MVKIVFMFMRLIIILSFYDQKDGLKIKDNDLYISLYKK